MLEGIDVSNWQGIVDWKRVRADNKVFADIKATEGLTISDYRFDANWHYSKAFGLKRIAYHFLRSNLNGMEQADFMHQTVRLHGAFHQGDAIMLDFETLDGATPREAIAQAEAFVLRAKQKIDKPVILYTYPDFWFNELGNPISPVLAQCPLHMASVGANPPRPKNWTVVSFWQYSFTGDVPGISGGVDLDRFMGNEHQLNLILNTKP